MKQELWDLEVMLPRELEVMAPRERVIRLRRNGTKGTKKNRI